MRIKVVVHIRGKNPVVTMEDYTSPWKALSNVIYGLGYIYIQSNVKHDVKTGIYSVDFFDGTTITAQPVIPND